MPLSCSLLFLRNPPNQHEERESFDDSSGAVADRGSERPISRTYPCLTSYYSY